MVLMSPEYVLSMVDHARRVAVSIEEHLPKGAAWLLGSLQPTTLDAHVVPFVVRMRDVGRGELIPARLMAYTEDAEKTVAWLSTTQGPSINIAAFAR